MMMMTRWSCCYCYCIFLFPQLVSSQLVESERLEIYRQRNHTWPPLPEDYNPDTPGWRNFFERRFEQLDKLDSTQNSYNGYVTAIHSAIISPNFTEYGWGLTKAPQFLVDELKQSLYSGYLQKQKMRSEGMIQCIITDDYEQYGPMFVDQFDLNRRALKVLHPIVEAWSGVKLKGNNAYGLRIYRNTSRLNMHVDKHDTHVVSAILHVGHDDNSEPWPLVIEDYYGNTNAVNLKEGDILLYESSKCYHGRPTKFIGEWYSSLFLHYYPTETAVWDKHTMRMDTHYRVPPIWKNSVVRNDKVVDIEVIDTSVQEPACPHTWCNMDNVLTWNGPGPGYGKVLTGGNAIYELDLPPEDDLARLQQEQQQQTKTVKREADTRDEL